MSFKRRWAPQVRLCRRGSDYPRAGGGITLTTWQAVRANRSRAEAQTARQNEAGLRQQADAASVEAHATLSASDFLQGVRFIAEDNANDAVPFLAQSVSVNPTNVAALTRLATLLTYHSWMLPTLILKHGSPVNSAEFSPDGKRIVTTSADGTAHVWDAKTGQPLVPPMKHPFKEKAIGQGTVFNVNQAGRLTSVDGLTSVTFQEYKLVTTQFSPDGKRIVTVSSGKTLRVWDAQSGQPLTAPMKHMGNVSSAQFSPDGERILTASGDNAAYVWEARTGPPLPLRPPLPLFHAPGGNSQWGPYARPRFSHDGRRIVMPSADKTVRVWDAQTGQLLTGPMKHRG